MIEDKIRRYRDWAGNPGGNPEDLTKCIVELWGRRWLSDQCSRKRGYGNGGLYCKQHAKMNVGRILIGLKPL